MKKSFVLAALAVAALVSCQKEMSPEEIIENGREGYVEVTLTAICDVTTKASLDGKAVIWEEGEKLAVYTDNSTASNIFTVKEVEGSNVVITGTVPEGATSFIAAYPYESAVSYSAGVLTMSVPAAQNVAEGEYVAPDALLSAAYFADAETPAQFRNVVSLLAFTVSDADVDSAEFGGGTTGGDNVITVELSADAEPVVTNVSGGFCVCVSAPDGFESGETYYATVPPTKAVSGFYATVRKSGRVAKRSSEKSFELVRNSGFNLGEIAADDAVYKFAQISNGPELKEFLEEAASYAADDVVEIVDDIDLSGMEIVTAESFAGVLDGKLHSIKNWTSDGVSLFGTVSGEVRDLTLDASCTFAGEFPADAFGYIVQKLTGKMENCHNKADVSFTLNESGIATRYFGTLAGRMPNFHSQLVDCSNSGNISIDVDVVANQSGAIHAGGLVGHVGNAGAEAVVRLLRCTNSGSVTVDAHSSSTVTIKNYYIGGVAGATGVNGGSASNTSGYTLYYGEIRNCSNSGDIKASWTGGTGGYFKVGGVIGVAEAGLFDCENTGSVDLTLSRSTSSSAPSVAGIAGVLAGQAPVSASGCVNRGAISFNGMVGNAGNDYTGGLGGQKMTNIGGCFGIVGDNTSRVENCDNYGNVTADVAMTVTAGSGSALGGVVGYVMCDMANCNNYASSLDFSSMTATAHMGGVAGYACKLVSGCKFSSAMNTKNDISSLTTNQGSGINNVGGVVGYSANGSTIENCSSLAGSSIECSSSAQLRFGGVAGMSYSQVSACENNAALTVARQPIGVAFATYAGGVVGRQENDNALIDLTNNGALSVTMDPASAYSYTAGVAAYIKCSSVKGCTNNGNVTMDGNGMVKQNIVTGVVGWNNVAMSIEDCTNHGNISADNWENSSYQYIAGICGQYNTGNNQYKNLTNTGNLTCLAKSKVAVGGIGAAINCKDVVENCHSTGEIRVENAVAASRVGGICGYWGKGNMSGSSCDMKISASGTGASYVGAALGALNVDSSWADVNVAGSVETSADFVGGTILGQFSAADKILTINGGTVSSTLNGAGASEDNYVGSVNGGVVNMP